MPDAAATSEHLSDRGNALVREGRIDEALAALQAAVAARPDFAIGHFNLARAFAAINRITEALAHYDRVLALKPGDPEALWAKGTVQILAGDYLQGWSNYRNRWQAPGFGDRRDFGTPRWSGAEPLQDRTLFIHAEQGFGDTIQFCRYIPLLADRGARVLFMAQPELRGLLAASRLPCELFGPGDGVPKFDFDIPLMDLPAALKTTLTTVPANVPYLTPPADKIARWSAVLGAKRRRRIGIAWSGRRTHRDDHLRSLPVECLAPLFALDAEVHVLQTDMTPAERTWLIGKARIFDVDRRDFGDAAAHVSMMDTVVSVDTAIAHLAGALEIPTHVLLPFSPDFRWGLGRTDTPWYPGMKLIRQSKFVVWSGVVEQAALALET